MYHRVASRRIGRDMAIHCQNINEVPAEIPQQSWEILYMVWFDSSDEIGDEAIDGAFVYTRVLKVLSCALGECVSPSRFLNVWYAILERSLPSRSVSRFLIWEVRRTRSISPFCQHGRSKVSSETLTQFDPNRTSFPYLS